MLIVARTLNELSFRDLMDIYEEGNRENGREFWPDLPEVQQMVLAEQDFRRYLRETFFPAAGAMYCIWKVKGKYVSALRLELYRDGLLLEALETAPGERRKGFGEALIHAVLERCGHTKIYSHVGKQNEPSLRIHEKCGFTRIKEYAVYTDGSVNHHCCTMLYQK